MSENSDQKDPKDIKTDFNSINGEKKNNDDNDDNNGIIPSTSPIIKPSEEISTCNNCGAPYEKKLNPLYCIKCGKVLGSSLFSEQSNGASLNLPKTEYTKDDFRCPRCHTESLQSGNPVFCITCGYRFPRDTSGKLLIDQDGYALMPMESVIPAISPMGYSPSFGLGPNRYNTMMPQKPKTWSIGAGIGVPLLTFILQTLILVGVTFLFLLLGGSINLTVLSEFFLGSASLLFLFIPMIWVQRYYPEKRLTFKERLALLGFDLNKFSRAEKGREILIGILFGAIGVVFVIGLQEASYYLVKWIYGIPPEFLLNDSFTQQFGVEIPATIGDLLLYVAMMVFFVGLSEEVMFRGFVQRSFESKLTRSAATVLTATYFAMFHIFIYLLNPPLFLFLFIPYLGISLLLGVLRNIRKDLLSPAIMHMVYNSLQIIIIFMIFF